MYVILGCGRVGARVAELLLEAGKTVYGVEKDASRVESLRERKFDVVQGDMLHVDLKQEPFRSAEAFLVLARDDETNTKVVKTLKKALPDRPIIARGTTPRAMETLKEAGANYVILGPDVVGNAVVKELTELELFKKTDELVRLIKAAGEGGLGIILHDAPDPDSIAGGLALQKIAEKFKVKSFIYYGGKIGHQQNRALVNLLGARMKQIAPGDVVAEILKRHGKTALLDCEVAGQNNILPRGYTPSIVIGHHLASGSRITGEFVDVRQNVGAVSTILLGYMQELGIVPDAKLSAALLHGIRVDTAGLTRHTSPSDLKAVAYLSPLVDQKILQEIEAPPMTNETLDIMGRAITDRKQKGAYLVTNAGFITDRDALPQAAEFLLNLEGVSTVLVFGIQGEQVHLSSRSRDPRINLGEVVQKAFGEMNAGGHALAAAGQIPLGILGGTEDKDDLLRLVENAVTKRFFAAVGIEVPETEAASEPAPSESEPPRKANGMSPRRASRRVRSA